MKVLIIDDQADIRASLRDLLELNGHEVLEAEDGVAGVRLAGLQPDFIICDLTMPRLDGRGVLAAVKRMPEVRDVPFVFLTAQAERGADLQVTAAPAVVGVHDAAGRQLILEAGPDDRGLRAVLELPLVLD
ncbi:MAG TPA: response regulator [Opitutus sp.]|nr:response regulator [Opitutus sp.]